MSFKTMMGSTWNILLWILRFLQFVMAVTVIGLYGTYVSRANQHHEGQDGRWVYALVVGVLAAITAIVYAIPRIPIHYAFPWDIVLFILWVAVFGIFGKLYIHEDAEGNKDIERMKSAVWIDLINMLLWFISAIIGAIMFFKYRGTRTTFTGRTTEHV